jgi:hypothetical protein
MIRQERRRREDTSTYCSWLSSVFTFSSSSYPLTSISAPKKKERNSTWHKYEKNKTSVNDDDRKMDANAYIIWTSRSSNNNKSITQWCVLKLETKEEMLLYIFSFFFFFSWALELVLPAGAPCNTHSFFFFFSSKKKRACEWFLSSVSARLSNTHTHTMIIILIINVFWLVAFACVKYRATAPTNNSRGTTRIKKNEHNRSDSWCVLVVKQKREKRQRWRRSSKRQSETNFAGWLVDRVKKEKS